MIKSTHRYRPAADKKTKSTDPLLGMSPRTKNQLPLHSCNQSLDLADV
jgi:hypothetical protein